ncbi:hypothetical protein [Paenibacillus naphthalenovorans]|uniref:hypothetical protein n=1 Tax=Paenibacillus naphthalenovorans TaxID=162209 RepID=UPI003D2B35A3
MRVGAFLLGGLVGVAAVVYLSNRNKSLFGAAFSSSDSVNPSMGMASSSGTIGQTKSGASESQSFQSGSKEKANKPKKGLNEDLFKEDGLNKVSDIVNQDPGLKAAVEKILDSNAGKEQYGAH